MPKGNDSPRLFLDCDGVLADFDRGVRDLLGMSAKPFIAKQGRESLLALTIGKDWKGQLSPALYLAAIPLAFVSSWVASALYVFVALLWLIPDPRIETLETSAPFSD